MRALYEEYGASVVLTGLDYEPGRVGSGCLENGELTISLHERIDCYYPGTGDVFAAVMLGALLGGAKLRDACVKAGEFVRDTIAYTAQQGTEPELRRAVRKAVTIPLAEIKGRACETLCGTQALFSFTFAEIPAGGGAPRRGRCSEPSEENFSSYSVMTLPSKSELCRSSEMFWSSQPNWQIS